MNTNMFDSSKYFTCWGEVLLRLSPPATQQLMQTNVFHSYFGGAEANCAVMLSQLGIKTKLITALPDNELGHAALRYFRSFGIDVNDIRLVSNSRLGLYFFEKGIGVRPSHLLYDRAHSAFALIQKGDINWRESLKDCGWFHTTGITLSLSPAIVEETMKACDIVKSNRGVVSFDINYRHTLWKDIKMAKRMICELVKKVDVLIGNEEHIKMLLLSENLPHYHYNDSIDYLFTNFTNLNSILLTHRYGTTASEVEIGAVAATRDTITELKIRKLHNVVDRVGSGDAMAAAFMYGLMSRYTLEHCVAFAVAAGALAHMIDGDNFIVSESDIVTVMEDKSWQLKR
ncbi:MAG: sugar kinase [Spirochaetes bacterium]|nr:sugar kinase [Spirochaetota bacterium]